MDRVIRAARNSALVGVIVAVAALACLAGEHKSASLSFVVVKAENGKPVRNAAVVLHPVKSNGDQALGGMELKTDNDGKTSIDGIPYGKLRVQVLAPHFKTYGQDFDISQPTVGITVKLEKPSDQYSIYK
jgi:5-hydroxyisourate hydrolase-like protein (transthyretin family)